MNTSIAVATPKDVRALVELRTAVARDLTRKFGEGHWSACPSRADVVRQVRASRVLVARRGTQIIGTVRLSTARPWAIDSICFTPVTSALYVLGLAVAPEARGQDVGGELMEAAKETARSWPIEALWLDAYDHAAGAGPFYLKCGFRKVGRTQYREVPLIYYEWLVQDEAHR
ncbi:MAG TPA: GNAT family N-acetyltransferase [Steroidobacteraceae bacterium]|nr:GNAT family N-acetyltransferase [Steroidobacteraceae bacterium]